MSSEQSPLFDDLWRLWREGGSDEQLAQCLAILALPLVDGARRSEVEPVIAARMLLFEAAARAESEENASGAAGGAYAGIRPIQTGSSVKGDAGTNARALSAGKKLGLSGERNLRAPKTVIRHLKNYEIAIRLFASTTVGDPARTREFLSLCGVQQERLPAPMQLLPFSPGVDAALEARRKLCADRGRPMYTSDVLHAVLDVQGSRAAICLNEVRPDLATIIRAELILAFGHLDTEPSATPYANFDWGHLPVVREAEQMAIGQELITEVHLLRAILNGSSETKEVLKDLLNAYDVSTAQGSSWQQLVDVVENFGRVPKDQLRTPRARRR